MLAEPAPRVFSHGDGNLDNWLWHDFISTIYALDWEFAGHSDAAYDAAELIEHPSATAIDDDLWLALLPELGVEDDQARRRLAAARLTGRSALAGRPLETTPSPRVRLRTAGGPHPKSDRRRLRMTRAPAHTGGMYR